MSGIEKRKGYSQKIIRGLQKREGMRLERIAELAGVSTHFLSRIIKGEDSFTVRQLLRIEDGVGKNICLVVISPPPPPPPPKDAPKEIRDLYRSLKKALDLSYKLRHPEKEHTRGNRKHL